MSDQQQSDTHLPRIYSPAEVIEMFSPVVRPSERVLIEKARATGHFSKMGRKIVFTRENIDDLIDSLGCRPKASRNSHRHRTRVSRTDGAYERVVARLEQAAKDRKEAAKWKRMSWRKDSNPASLKSP